MWPPTPPVVGLALCREAAWNGCPCLTDDSVTLLLPLTLSQQAPFHDAGQRNSLHGRRSRLYTSFSATACTMLRASAFCMPLAVLQWRWTAGSR